MQLYIYLAVATLLSTTTFVCADHTADTKAINRLTVEAATLYQQGINADNPQEAIAAFENALANLDHIVKTYPETDIAVSLATTGRIGGLHRDNIQMMLNMSRQVLEKTKETKARAEELFGQETPDTRLTRLKEAEKAYAAWYRRIQAAAPLVALVAQGNFDEARTQAAAIENEDDRDAAYAAIAGELARLGDVDEALNTAYIASDRQVPQMRPLMTFQQFAVFQIMAALRETGKETYAAELLYYSHFNESQASDIIYYLWDNQWPERPPEDWTP